MKSPDLDRIRSERPLSLPGFLKIYNDDLPTGFPAATIELLREFKKTHRSFFRLDAKWSLDQHRKRVMDWLPARYRRDVSE
ncbi:MAG TPA: hypothetical protein VGB97_00285 [Candidatus Paceibacterota bacterium]|jgi:hypothetical protein